MKLNETEKSIMIDQLWQKYQKSKSTKDYDIWFNLCTHYYPKR
mgnify:CR=1 FL=1